MGFGGVVCWFWSLVVGPRGLTVGKLMSCSCSTVLVFVSVFSATYEERLRVDSEVSSGSPWCYVGISGQGLEWQFPFACVGLAVSPGKPQVPYCEERPGAAHSRRDQNVTVPLKPLYKGPSLVQ